jgi:hypothetical protein
LFNPTIGAADPVMHRLSPISSKGGDDDDRYKFYPWSRDLPRVEDDGGASQLECDEVAALPCVDDEDIVPERVHVGPLSGSCVPLVDPLVCQECGARFATRSSASRHLYKTCFRKSGHDIKAYACTALNCGHTVCCYRVVGHPGVVVDAACGHKT